MTLYSSNQSPLINDEGSSRIPPYSCGDAFGTKNEVTRRWLSLGPFGIRQWWSMNSVPKFWSTSLVNVLTASPSPNKSSNIDFGIASKLNKFGDGLYKSFLSLVALGNTRSINSTSKMACLGMTFGRNTNLGLKFGIFFEALSCGLSELNGMTRF